MGEASGAGLYLVNRRRYGSCIKNCCKILTDKDNDDIEYKSVRGVDGVKVTEIEVPVVQHSVQLLHTVLEMPKVPTKRNGEEQYHFIEIWLAGWIGVNGGGQPIQPQC